ncbi:MAG: response regulator transcription factor [Lentisphaeraceae bacterium]|nr:response regulator transcription factor [Lentisphaeraceae bacterium]
MKNSILIIEDDPALLFGLKENFQMAGFETFTADNGKDGLKEALSCNPDIILLDIMLPGMNGYEICNELRKRHVGVPIIMMTAKDQEEDIVRGLDVGADDYVTKPFSIKELMARVKAFLRRHKPESENISFGPFTLDLVSHSFFKNNESIKLMPKEFNLLKYFVANNGRALSRSEIMDNVWGRDVVVTNRSVDRCITTLRSKLDDNPSEPRYIKTVRDVGYRFDS